MICHMAINSIHYVLEERVQGKREESQPFPIRILSFFVCMYFFIKSIILFYCVVLQTAKIAKKNVWKTTDLPTSFLNQISRPDRGLCFFKNGGYTV